MVLKDLFMHPLKSLYGKADTNTELEEDSSFKNPITAYAKTKWLSEQELIKLNDQNFTVTFLRPSTVFGSSPRLRCDIVYNNLLACGYTSGEIVIKSDGKPWRPVVHVQDVSHAFIAALEAPKKIVSGKAFNVGIPNGNFTVKQLAKAAHDNLTSCSLKFNENNTSDERTYRVSFKRILNDLRNHYTPSWNLKNGEKKLLVFLKKIILIMNIFLEKLVQD